MLAVLLAGSVPATADIDSGAESDLISRINAERTSRGLPALRVRSDLRDAARRHANRMADRGQLYHNPNLGSEVCCWRKVGENVGTGSSTARIHQMMMGSSSHRRNILDPDFTELGIGVERRGDTIWVSEVFRLPQGAPEPEPPPPPPPAAQEPAPPPPPRSPAPSRRAEPAPPEPATPQPPPRPEPLPEPPPPCTDATSLSLARTLAAQTGGQTGEVLATICPRPPVESTGFQR